MRPKARWIKVESQSRPDRIRPPILQRHMRLRRAALFLTDNLPSRTSVPGARLRCGFVDIDQGCCILEKVSVTACPDYASKSEGHMRPRTSYPPE